MRSRRAGLKKIGVLALALVIALGSLGVAYSAWIDSVYVEGTVCTGTLDIDVTGCSSTFVYKVPGAEDTGFGPETVVNFIDNSEDPSPPPGGTLVASAVTTYITNNDTDEAAMAFSGLFPCIDFRADLELTYRGTVPGKVSVAIITPNTTADMALADLWELGKATKDDPIRTGAWIEGKLSTDDGGTWIEIEDPLGLQLHRNDVAHITLHVHIPQGEEWENKNLNFTGLITVIQWNLYEEEE